MSPYAAPPLPAPYQPSPSGSGTECGVITRSSPRNSATPTPSSYIPQYTSPMRASMVANTRVPPRSRYHPCASAASEETGTTGRSAPYAIPWTTPAAMRRPVNAPGPRPKETASSCVGGGAAARGGAAAGGGGGRAGARGAGAGRAAGAPAGEGAAGRAAGAGAGASGGI